MKDFQQKDGIHNVLIESIMRSDADIQDDLWANIRVVGGCSVLPNLSERIVQEMSNLSGVPVDARVVRHPASKCSRPRRACYHR